jgi:AMIN domain
MSRWPYFGALVAVAALAGPLVAQNGTTVRDVVVRGSDDAIEIEIQTSGATVSPNTQAVTGPDRIVVDFPGAMPSSELHNLKVNRGALKGVRSGLFFSNPPITRVVLDLSGPQIYRISTLPNATIVKLGPPTAAHDPEPAKPAAPSTRIQNAAFPGSANASPKIAGASISIVRVPVNTPVSSPTSSAAKNHTSAAPATTSTLVPGATSVVATKPATPTPNVAPAATEEPPKPAVTVSYENGMLHIHAEKATLAQVLFEVHQQTQADIAIPAGAEKEEVVADIGPAPARDVLGTLLNGSPYNFIFVGNELALERVILTRRDPSIF